MTIKGSSVTSNKKLDSSKNNRFAKGTNQVKRGQNGEVRGSDNEEGIIPPIFKCKDGAI